MACPECLAFPGRKNYREGKARKDRSGIREHGKCRDHGETEGVKGLWEERTARNEGHQW